MTPLVSWIEHGHTLTGAVIAWRQDSENNDYAIVACTEDKRFHFCYRDNLMITGWRTPHAI